MEKFMSNTFPHSFGVTAELKARYGGSYSRMREVLWDNAPAAPADEIPWSVAPTETPVLKALGNLGRTYTKKSVASSIDLGRYMKS